MLFWAAEQARQPHSTAHTLVGKGLCPKSAASCHHDWLLWALWCGVLIAFWCRQRWLAGRCHCLLRVHCAHCRYTCGWVSVCVCESRRWNCQFANVHVCLIFDFYLTLNDTSISILFNAIKRISRKVLVEMWLSVLNYISIALMRLYLRILCYLLTFEFDK